MEIVNDTDLIYGATSTGVSSYGSMNAMLGGLVIFGAIFSIVGIAISVLMIISLWKIFKKNGVPGWHTLIPFLNMWDMLVIGNQPGWGFLVPFYNIYVSIMANVNICKKMGKSTGFAVLTIFFPYIGYPILAFSKDKNAINNNSNPVNNNMNNNMNTMNGMNTMDTMNNSMNTMDTMNNLNNVGSMPEVKPVDDIFTAPIAPINDNNIINPSVSNDETHEAKNGYKCPNCGHDINPSYIYCPNCNTKL